MIMALTQYHIFSQFPVSSSAFVVGVRFLFPNTCTDFVDDVNDVEMGLIAGDIVGTMDVDASVLAAP